MAVPEIVGPTLLTAVGQEYTEPAQIRGILWEGATSAGDTCEVVERTSGRLLFAGRATGSQTWEGMILPVTAPTGFKLSVLAAGRVIVYHAEPDAI